MLIIMEKCITGWFLIVGLKPEKLYLINSHFSDIFALSKGNYEDSSDQFYFGVQSALSFCTGKQKW